MRTDSVVAKFIAGRIRETGKSQLEIAKEVGFETPNIVSMIKCGHTKVPVAKIGLMAKALETDPVHFLHLCLSEYQPDTWEVIAPYMESGLTADELNLIKALRHSIGGPYLSALNEDSKRHFRGLMESLRTPNSIH